jgi:hypothetical protein
MPRIALVLALLAACGDDGGSRNEQPDAPVEPDGMVDPGMARVTVTSLGAPRANQPVTFQGPDGAEIATVMTDASGVATATVPEGSYVTAYDIYNLAGPQRSIVTVMGVKPGDAIEIRGDAGLPGPELAFSFASYAGAASYGISSTCAGDGVGTDTMPSLATNACGPRVDTMIGAADANGNTLAYLAKLDQPSDQVIDLTGDAWTEAQSSTTTYTNVPAFIESRATKFYTTPRGTFATCRENAWDGGEYDFLCPEVPGATVVEELWLWSDPRGLYVYTPSQAGPIDLATADVKNVTEYGTIDQTTRELTWAESTGATPQFLMVQVGASGVDQNPFQWEIVAPYTGASLVLPTLIGEGAMYTDPGEAGGYIRLGTAEGGYDAVRQLGPMYLGVRVNAETGRMVLTAHEAG